MIYYILDLHTVAWPAEAGLARSGPEADAAKPGRVISGSPFRYETQIQSLLRAMCQSVKYETRIQSGRR